MRPVRREWYKPRDEDIRNYNDKTQFDVDVHATKTIG